MQAHREYLIGKIISLSFAKSAFWTIYYVPALCVPLCEQTGGWTQKAFLSQALGDEVPRLPWGLGELSLRLKKKSVFHTSPDARGKPGDSTGEQRVLCREAESVAWLNVKSEGICILACLQQRAGSYKRTAGQHSLPDLGTLDQNAQHPRSGALQLQVTSKKYHAHRTKESSSHQTVPSKLQTFASFGLFPLSCGHFHCCLSYKKQTFFLR